MPTPSRALYVYSGDGLSNRLMLLFSGRALAQAGQRAFGMDWFLKSTCNCPFDQLFAGDWNVRLVETFNGDDWTDLRTVSPNRFPDLLRAPEPILRIRFHDTLIRPDLYPAHRALETSMQAELSRLQPIPAIAARIESFVAQHFRPVMVSVHLRRGDFNSARQDRIGNLESAFAAIDQYLTRAPDAGILLCTDDGAPEPHSGAPSTYTGVREQFQQRYPARVVMTTPRSLDRNTPESIQDAVMDLMLLRRTDYFVGTQDSTFSTLAVFGRDIPFVMTAGASAAYEARLRFLKRTGIYYVMRGIGRIEFGPNVPYWRLVLIYKRRLFLLRQFLRGERAASSERTARD